MLQTLIIAICSSFLLLQTSLAQSEQPKTTAPSQYMILYNGQIEQPYTRKYLNTPYYQSSTYVKGELVTLSGIHYKDISVRLDLFKHQLIVLSPVTEMQIIVPWQRVSQIHLHNQTFSYHQQTTLPGDPYSGYIREVYKSPKYHMVETFSFDQKSQQSDRTIRTRFVQKNKLFLIRADRWTPIKSLSDILKLFPNDKKQIKQYIKESQLDKQTNPDFYWSSVLLYCEKLQIITES